MPSACIQKGGGGSVGGRNKIIKQTLQLTCNVRERGCRWCVCVCGGGGGHCCCCWFYPSARHSLHGQWQHITVLLLPMQLPVIVIPKNSSVLCCVASIHLHHPWCSPHCCHASLLSMGPALPALVLPMSAVPLS